MKYILSSSTGILTARTLGKIAGIPVYRQPKLSPPTIRWGSVAGNYANDTQYNSIETILKASNKITLANFLSKNKIPVVEFHRGIEPTQYPIVVRKLMNSCQGKGIVIVDSKEKYLPNLKQYYFSYFEEFEFELRVHLVAGKVVRIFKKMVDKPEEKFPIRNIGSGYHFGLRELKNYPKAVTLAEEVYKLFPINLAGFDMGYSKKQSKYIIIEINTCPSLNDNTAQIYIDTLRAKGVL